jgi:hypothetical protein
MQNLKVYKTYYFNLVDGESSSDMVEVYCGDSLESADKAADRWEQRGYCVEIWYGNGDQEDELIDR